LSRHRIDYRYEAGLLAAYCGALVLFFFAPKRNEFPLAVLSISAYFITHLFVARTRPRVSTLLCPLNVIQFLYMMQLVFLPLIIVFFGFSKGVLEYLPSETARNVGILLAIVSFLSFTWGFGWTDRKLSRLPDVTGPDIAGPAVYPRVTRTLLVLFLALGVFGYYLMFPSLISYLNYLSDPTGGAKSFQDMSGTLQGAASTFFRPFLGYAVVLAWALWIDRRRLERAMLPKVAWTSAALATLTIVNLGYSFNRGALLGPMAALLAVYSSRVRRISNAALIAGGSVVLAGAILLGEYRLMGPSPYAVGLDDLGKRVQLSDWVQVYGSAPQFAGFLIESLDYGTQPKWGETLLSSVLFPVPVLGKSFRESSGVTLYNKLIYGSVPSADQVIPFDAEVFVNFHVFGVIIAFFLVGLVIAYLQSRFTRASNSFEAYYHFLMSVWISFLVIGSAAVTSQIFIYFFWSVYLYMLSKHISGTWLVEQSAPATT
jgi:hypothetical protein